MVRGPEEGQDLVRKGIAMAPGLRMPGGAPHQADWALHVGVMRRVVTERPMKVLLDGRWQILLFVQLSWHAFHAHRRAGRHHIHEMGN